LSECSTIFAGVHSGKVLISRIAFTDPAPKWFTWGLSARFPAILPHRITPHLDAMGVVIQPVENA